MQGGGRKREEKNGLGTKELDYGYDRGHQGEAREQEMILSLSIICWHYSWSGSNPNSGAILK